MRLTLPRVNNRPHTSITRPRIFCTELTNDQRNGAIARLQAETAPGRLKNPSLKSE